MLLGERTGVWSGGGALPYIPLEYIEATGTQYLNTGILSSADCRWELDLQYMTNMDGSFNGFGHAAPWRFTISQYYSSQIVFGCNDVVRFTANSLVRHLCVIDAKNAKVWVDAESKDAVGAPTVYGNIGIFCRNTSRDTGFNPQYLAKMRLYSSKIYKNDVLVSDIVPCKDMDGVVCVYDRVCETFLYNQGTGSFVEPSAGGGYKLKCARRSHRRSSRPSARFCATSRRWEVAA